MLGCTLCKRDQRDAVAPAARMRVAREERLKVGIGDPAQPRKVVVIERFVRAGGVR
ncbi:MAG TPA: hypothetical protein VE736_10495 [Gaiellaceae bacterium]|jgi:hypothetical protein|nr:hypothetical protein [Gaiellaceae bacterium]